MQRFAERIAHLDFNLDEMSLEELRSLRGQVDRAITGYSERKRREAIAAAEEAVKKHGFSLADLTSSRRRGRGSKAAARPGAEEARYVNPGDPSQTWSGRGRRPRWIQDAIAGGAALEDFAR